MTLYPRRDVVHVAVSPHQGGCGAAHSRPVTHGAPDLDWVLNCPRCERALNGHPQWASTRAEIPETPDEQRQREALETRGSRDRETVITAALAKLAGIADGIGSQQPLLCKRGHRNLPSSRFCGECGAPLAEEQEWVAKAAKAHKPEPAADFTRMPVSQLRRIATERGINPGQSKKDLVTALSG